MRLLHVINSINPVGGGPIEGLRQLDIYLAQRGVQAQICSNDPPDAPYVVNSGLDLVALGPSRLRYGFNTRIVSWLREHAADYDVIIVHGIWQFHSLATWLALRGGRTPYFVFTHGMLDPWFKERYPLKHLKKSLYWAVGDYWVLRDARAVLFTAEDERLRARESFALYQCREQVTTFGTSPPPPDRAAMRTAFTRAFPATAGRRNLLFLGRIHEKKGVDLLMQAFGRVASMDPSLHLIMAGPCDTPMRHQLEGIAHAAGVGSRVTWTGMLQGDLKWGAFEAAEAFCLPSHQENFGVAVAESLACGVPVLISNKVNIWREIEGDGAGMICDDTQEDAERVLRQWIGTPASDRARMREQAMACFEQRFQSSRFADRLLEIVGAPGAALQPV